MFLVYLNYSKQISMSGFLGNTSMFLMGIGLVPLSLVQLKVDALYLSISVTQTIVVSTEIWSKILLCACSFTLEPSEYTKGFFTCKWTHELIKYFITYKVDKILFLQRKYSDAVCLFSEKVHVSYYRWLYFNYV